MRGRAARRPAARRGGGGRGGVDAAAGPAPRRPGAAPVDPQAGARALTGTVGYVTGPVAGLKPNPLAGTGVDPLDNGVGTQLADFKPVGSQMLTRPLAQAQSLGSVPVVGQVLGGLSH
ncbi:hypothetical protein [Streptomyces canarius]